jgi:nitrite reductase/ring-hydroxylating ferredoxin subunit
MFSLQKHAFFIICSISWCVQGFVIKTLPLASFVTEPKITSTMRMAKNRKSLRKTLQNDANSRGIKPMNKESDLSSSSTGSASKKKSNWVPVQGISSLADLPNEQGSVKLVDTMAEQLMNSATNPTGAVSIVNYNGKTYCFSSSCARCQIPLTKASVLEPTAETGTDPRLSCDFCKATFNIRTGEMVQDSSKAGLLGGIVTTLFSKTDKVPLKIYDLGEKNGSVLINLP